MSALQTFRHYRISQDPSGGAVELWRCGSEIACLAVDTLRQVFVELHVAMPGERERDHKQFMLNCQVAQQARHRNALAVLDCGEDEGADYFVTEYVDGERLETFLARTHPVPIWLALLIARQVADGLAALNQHPKLLAGVELFHSTIALLGESVGDFNVKVADYGLSRELPAGSLQMQAAETRAIRELGHLLHYMLTGTMTEGSTKPKDLARLTPEFAFVLDAIFDSGHQHHPRTIEQLRTLLGRCAEDLPAEQVQGPERIPPTFRPRLPLQVNFSTPEELSEELSDDFQLDHQPFDAVVPYRHAATTRATRQPVVVQVLPPERLMPPDYTRAIRQAISRINPLDHPNLIRVLDFPSAEAPQYFVEEAPGKYNLANVVRLRGGLTPLEAVLILEQVEEATKQAEACGLVPVVRSPRELYFQFIGPGGDGAVASEKELAETDLASWPAFRLRARTFPTTLNLAQPEAFLTERHLPAAAAAIEPTGNQKQSSFLVPPSARDYALLCSFMMGRRETPDKVRHLIFDYMGNRKASTLGGAREFLERISTAVGRVVTKSVVKRTPTITKRKRPVRPSEEEESDLGLEFQPEPDHNPVQETPDFIPLGRDSVSLPGKKDRAPMVGFAEALFGASRVGGDEESPVPQRSGRRNSRLVEPEPRTFLDGPLEPEDEDEDLSAYLLTDEDRRPNTLLLMLLVLAVAALLAGAIAHFTGTGFWR